MKSLLDTTEWRYNPVFSLLDPLEAPIWSDSRISAKSKGIWGYMKSKPYGWDFSADRMAMDFTDGKKAIQSAFKELVKNGYMSRIKLSTGRVHYTLSDDPWIGVEPTIKKSPLARFNIILDHPATDIGYATKDAVEALRLAYGVYSITKEQALKAIDGRTFSSYNDIIDWMDSHKDSIDQSLELPTTTEF